MQIPIFLVLFTSIILLQEVLRWIRSIVAEFGTPNISTEQLADYINKTLSKGQVCSMQFFMPSIFYFSFCVLLN